ncbi:MAG: ABC transporter ATP-binding protein, partial [Verrucomicrobiae bacterium]|nr:ABC transporter ATP-binding protein [Verrucomicrobiae bacterium]
MSSVRFRNLTKVFPGDRKHPEVTALKGIDLEIRDHEFMVLVGPSGCGKTTTLRMLAGLESVTEGECFIGEQMVNGLPPKDRNIAMVFQNFALYPHMTVFENLAFGLKLQKLPMDELRNRVHEAAEILGLSDLLNRKP